MDGKKQILWVSVFIGQYPNCGWPRVEHVLPSFKPTDDYLKKLILGALDCERFAISARCREMFTGTLLKFWWKRIFRITTRANRSLEVSSPGRFPQNGVAITTVSDVSFGGS